MTQKLGKQIDILFVLELGKIRGKYCNKFPDKTKAMCNQLLRFSLKKKITNGNVRLYG